MLTSLNPWPSLAACRHFLRGLVGLPSDSAEFQSLPPQLIAEWATTFGLGALASIRNRERWPALAQQLRGESFSVAAENAMQFQGLGIVLDKLNSAEITPLIFKGAILAHSVYPSPKLRPMTDVDLWVEEADVERAAHLIEQLGYERKLRNDRPEALQKLAQGEIELFHPTWQRGAIDLHYSPFHGWWFLRATKMRREDVWVQRQKATVAGREVWRFSAEDTILQLALHLAINEQFAPHASIRSLVDIALVAHNETVDWGIIVQRAKRWQISHVIWTVLTLLQQFIGVAEADEALEALKPSRMRGWLIGRLVSAETILAQRNVQFTLKRIPILLALTDTWSGVQRFIWRAIWPDAEWRAARYGQPVSQWGHLRRLLSQRFIKNKNVLPSRQN
ncbi:MAG: nucleotidyltransferase domain-containing protein [Candidatus Promineifilaceae bacterium]